MRRRGLLLFALLRGDMMRLDPASIPQTGQRIRGRIIAEGDDHGEHI
jgi:hypothetical protein